MPGSVRHGHIISASASFAHSSDTSRTICAAMCMATNVSRMRPLPSRSRLLVTAVSQVLGISRCSPWSRRGDPDGASEYRHAHGRKAGPRKAGVRERRPGPRCANVATGGSNARRQFLILSAPPGTAWPLLAIAQGTRLPRIGILVLGNPDPRRSCGNSAKASASWATSKARTWCSTSVRPGATRPCSCRLPTSFLRLQGRHDRRV